MLFNMTSLILIPVFFDKISRIIQATAILTRLLNKKKSLSYCVDFLTYPKKGMSYPFIDSNVGIL